MTSRKFYLTTLVIKVLSEEPYVFDDLDQLARDLTDGPCVGVVGSESSAEITGLEAAQKLNEFGSDPEFFDLNDDGTPREEEA